MCAWAGAYCIAVQVHHHEPAARVRVPPRPAALILRERARAVVKQNVVHGAAASAHDHIEIAVRIDVTCARRRRRQCRVRAGATLHMHAASYGTSAHRSPIAIDSVVLSPRPILLVSSLAKPPVPFPKYSSRGYHPPKATSRWPSPLLPHEHTAADGRYEQRGSFRDDRVTRVVQRRVAMNTGVGCARARTYLPRRSN